MSFARALALVALVALPGCAAFTASAPQTEAPRPIPRRVAAETDRAGSAYYHFSVAQMHARAGRMPEALTELRQAIQSDPRTAALWMQMAQWQARSNQPAEAIAAAQKAIELEPQNTAAHLTLAELYRRAAATARGGSRAREGHHHRPALAGGVSRPGPAALRAEELRQGARGPAPSRDRAPGLGPGALSPGPHRHRDRKLGRGARPPEAGGRAGAGPRRRLEALGFVYETQKKVDEAVETYRAAIRANPDNAALRRAAGRPPRPHGALQGGPGGDRAARRGRAARSARVAASSAPSSTSRRRGTAAAASFRRALLLEPGNIRARYFLATTLMEAGKDDEAKRRAGADPRRRSTLGGRAGAARLSP